MVPAPETEADFERMSWHGCRVWKIEILAGEGEGQADLVQPLSIAEITRAPMKDPSYQAWRVGLGWPRNGEIKFGATGFDQVLLAEPIISETNFLTGWQRRKMLG